MKELDALKSVAVRILHDGAQDSSFLDGGDHFGAFVKRRQLDRSKLAGLLQHLYRQRGVVFKESSHERKLWVLDHHILNVCLRLGAVKRIRPRADDGVARLRNHFAWFVITRGVCGAAKEAVNESLPTALGVVLLKPTDENRYLTTCASFACQLAAHHTGVVIVHADVAEARRLGRV